MHIGKSFSRLLLITLIMLVFGWTLLSRIWGGPTDDWIGFLLVALSALCVVTALLLQSLSILFAPVAGFICYQYAKKDGLNCWLYAAVGSVSSILLIAPFIFVRARMAGKGTSVGKIKQGYRRLHDLWGCLIVSNAVIVFLVYDFACCSLEPSIPTFITLAFGVLTLAASMLFISNHRFNQEEFDCTAEDGLPRFKYALPFTGAVANIPVVPIAITVSFVTSY
ncbi:MAG: hypothetical protein F4X34_05920 [Chloroflexi bacterium]|nr:hypothetical protein [Chloroflexota bacterium]MYE54716.1 hypothetical protein [Chloroflexota bacterium]